VQRGAKNLLSCYRQFWSKGKMARMRSPFCNAANAGQLPTKDEVAYATYLLTGKAAFKYGGTMVPRWTLNENPD
jgi:hypothetical protein